MSTSAFWEEKDLYEMTREEWESLCDGCAKCCLHKFIEDDDVEEQESTDKLKDGEQLIFTNIVCSLLNTKTCSCTKYTERSQLVPDCVKLTRENLDSIFFMPPSCTYRRLHEGRGLPSWHPLLHKGAKSKMHKAGMSVRGKTVYEHDVDLQQFENYIVSWPLADLD
ncbi:YcgN family cysteine cluster protein [Paraneptunicella aestuarii]|uniref:YcgN family cysteine cluster protein n=1 Tax=Paraneptunicella aestuarii TaxID=2831148 RepID=UPI001E2CD3D4|nr:YcgN family cysteine cluster protein [Paraneptunicella aestuarii]UAA39817.1 YcgN family cysteine cluster protein [Paraneptunicella aestuarii]